MKEYNNNEKKSRGYIKLYRKIIDSEIWDKSPSYLKLWVWMLCKAQYKDGNIARGQFKTSIKEIQFALSYREGNETIHPSRRTIFRILHFLEQHKAITRQQINEKNPRKTMLITILNYDKYQGSLSQNAYAGTPQSVKKTKNSAYRGTLKKDITIGHNNKKETGTHGSRHTKNQRCAIQNAYAGTPCEQKCTFDGQLGTRKKERKNIYIHKETNNSICTHQQRLKFDFGSPYCDIRKGEKQLHISQVLSALLQKGKHSNTQKHKGGGLDEEARRNKLIEDFNQYLKQKGAVNGSPNSMSKPEKQ